MKEEQINWAFKIADLKSEILRALCRFQKETGVIPQISVDESYTDNKEEKRLDHIDIIKVTIKA